MSKKLLTCWGCSDHVCAPKGGPGGGGTPWDPAKKGGGTPGPPAENGGRDCIEETGGAWGGAGAETIGGDPIGGGRVLLTGGNLGPPSIEPEANDIPLLTASLGGTLNVLATGPELNGEDEAKGLGRAVAEQ